MRSRFYVLFFIAPRCYLSDGCVLSDGRVLSDGCVLSDGGAETQLNHAVLLFWRTPGAISPIGALLNRNTPGHTGDISSEDERNENMTCYRPAAVALKFIFMSERSHRGAIRSLRWGCQNTIECFYLVFLSHPGAISPMDANLPMGANLRMITVVG